MGRVLAGLVGLIVVIALIFAGWYYRPWSPFSPAQVTALDNPDTYTETFQRMDEILPSTVITASRPASLPEAMGDLPETYIFDGETRQLSDYMERAQVTGFAVLRDGALVSESYFHAADSDTRHTSHSVAKSFVATLIAKAMQDGLIGSLDDTADQYAPQFEQTDFGDTSLRHLLMMSTGIDFNEEYSESGDSDIRPLFFNAFIMGRNVDTMVAAFERNRAPGEDLDYISPASHVLAAVVRGVYGGRLADIVTEQIWEPLGMTSDASWLQNKAGDDGIAIGYCCLQATSRDYARFGEFYRLDGVWNGERLLPEGWVMQATRPNAPFQEPGSSPYPNRGYGLHFWIPENYDGEYFMAGVFGQYVWVDERRGVVIAQNAGNANWTALTLETFAVFRAVAEHVSPLQSRVEPTEIATETDDAASSDAEASSDQETDPDND